MVQNNKLVVAGTQASQQLIVYALNGQIVKQITTNAGQTEVNLNTGMYVIKVGNKVMKAIL